MDLPLTYRDWNLPYGKPMPHSEPYDEQEARRRYAARERVTLQHDLVAYDPQAQTLL